MFYKVIQWEGGDYWGYVAVPEEIFNKIDRSLCTDISEPDLLDLLGNNREMDHLRSLGIDPLCGDRYGWDYYKVGILKDE